MRNTFAFILVLLIVSLLGVVWGIYDYQTEKGLTTPETISLIDKFIYSCFKHNKPVFSNTDNSKKIPSKIQEEVITSSVTSNNIPPKSQENVITPGVTSGNIPLGIQEPVITPLIIATITPTRTIKYTIKPEARKLVEQGNLSYDEGIQHLQNTFKKDDTFEKENNKAIEKFREALKKYLEAERIDSESQWLMNRIRDTNQNLGTCRKQARRH
ncbi:MAG: hypothetical protein V1709_00455 [Planctomycetota bacterium]